MMKITISCLEVGSISNIGSLNIGKTILSNNRASISEIPVPEPNDEVDVPLEVPHPVVPHPVVPPPAPIVST